MDSGYLLKRQNGISPPSPQRVYCVLWGSCLLDFDSEEQAQSMLPRLVTEVLGVSEWDDQTRGNQYRNGFLIVTTKGSEYHCWASTPEERQGWMMNIRRSVECHFANSEISPFHKSQKFVETKPRHIRNLICPITKAAMAPLEKYTHKHVLAGSVESESGPDRFERNLLQDNDSLEDEMNENNVYSESEKVQLRIDRGMVTSDPPYVCPQAQLCTSCGRGFSSAEYVSEFGPPLQQLGQELQEKMCSQCSLMQSVILWLKSLNYTNASEIHELTPEVNKEIRKFKDTFKLRRTRSERLDMAACLFEEGNISVEEFQVLRELDDDYRREELVEEAGKLKTALDALGTDMQTILSLLLNSAATEKGGILSYHYVILKILEIADDSAGGAELVDFYFPQLVQVHLLECKNFTQKSLLKTDELQQCLLTLALKYPPLSTKLAWLLLASIGDYFEKPTPRITRSQYCGCLALLMQLEMIMTGYVSCLADHGSSIPVCQQLLRVMQPAPHQQSELGFELSALFLSRRKLQEMNQSQVLAKRQKKTGRVDIRRASLGKEEETATVEASSEQIEEGETGNSTSNVIDIGDENDKEDSGDGGVIEDPVEEADCVTIIKHLGVGGSEGSVQSGGKHGRVKMPSHWTGFSIQLDFLDKLTSMVDSLRDVERPQRTPTFQSRMQAWNEDGIEVLASRPLTKGLAGLCGNARYGFDPVVTAGEPMYRITKVLADNCRVFRTKARAPSLLVYEVVRDNIYKELVSYSRDAYFVESGYEDNSEKSPGSCVSSAILNHVSGASNPTVASSGTRRLSGGRSSRRGSLEGQQRSRTCSKDSSEGSSQAAQGTTRPISPPQSPASSCKMSSDALHGGGGSGSGRRTTLIGSSAKQRQRTRTSSADAIFIAAINNEDSDATLAGTGSLTMVSGRPSSKEAGTLGSNTGLGRPLFVNSSVVDDDNTSKIVIESTGTQRDGIETTDTSHSQSSSSVPWVEQEKEAERDALNFIDSKINATISMLHDKEKEEKERAEREERKSEEESQVRQGANVSTPTSLQHVSSLPGSREVGGKDKDSRGGASAIKSRPLGVGPALLSATRKGTGAAFASLLHSASFGDLQLATDNGSCAGETSDIHNTDQLVISHQSQSAPSSPERRTPQEKIRNMAGSDEQGADASDKITSEGTKLAVLSESHLKRSPFDVGMGIEPTDEDEDRYNRILRSANRLLASGQVTQEEYRQLIMSEARYQKELAIEKVEALSRAEGSFGEPWDSRKQRALRYHAANMPVGVIVSTLRNRVREAMSLEAERKDSEQQKQLTSPRRGLRDLSPQPGVQHTSVTVDVGNQILSTSSEVPNIEESQELVDDMNGRRSFRLDVRRRLSASQPTGLEEWVDSSNAGLGGGFDIDSEERDSEKSRSRSSSIAITDTLIANATSTISLRPSQQTQLQSPHDIGTERTALVSPSSVDPRERSASGVSPGMTSLSVTPVGSNTIWHEISSDDAKRQQSDRPLGYGLHDMANVAGTLGQSSLFLTNGDSNDTLKNADEDDIEYAYFPRVDLRAFIVKSNDDLRQEMVVLQLMRLCAEIWHDYGLDGQLCLRPYNIICTSNNTGVVEVIQDAMSLDALKKTEGFTTLPAYFESTYGANAEVLHAAKSNFTRSLAAYSIFTYLLHIKDRHNGNILVGSQGHLMHIDFGFLLGIAPGGAFSLESAPFKLTEEFVEVMGGLESPMFTQFVRSFTTGMLALRTNSENIISTLRVVSQDSPFPCFVGKDVDAILERFRGRFRCELSTKGFAQHCLDLIIASYSHYGTRQYDSFQYYSNGISV